MVEQGARIFDHVVVAVGVNAQKKPIFPLSDRLDMLRVATSSLVNVSVSEFANKTFVKYAKSISAQFVLRGIRTSSDYEQERTRCHVNRDLEPGIVTWFLMPPRELAEVSSSLVRELIGLEGWEEAVRCYVPEPVLEKLKEVHRAR